VAGFVLVHGAWHGAWCWRDVVRELESRGHAVEAVDLPGHGENPAAPGSVGFDEYVDTVCAAVARAPRPLVLVGHSLGGLPITQAAERLPERIDLLAYVAAFLPADGQALRDLTATDHEDSLIVKNLVVDRVAGTSRVDAAALRETFYGECDPADAEWAERQLVPESLRALSEPVRITSGRGGGVPRMYVEALRDRAVTVRKQRAMQAAVPCGLVRTLEADHSPFLSAPLELSACLEEGADAVRRSG
jgi:pimeloyl-ACP methyl ester carboxylesterase